MELGGFTIWLTGLPGAGKTTLATAVGRELMSRGRRVELLDGDEVRRTFSPELGYSRVHRDINVKRIGYIANVLSRNGIIVVVAAISPYASARSVVRRLHGGRFVEVYLECSLSELVRRDPKGMYGQALAGSLVQFTGVSDPYEIPSDPELTIVTEHESVLESAQKILEFMETRGMIDSRATLPIDAADQPNWSHQKASWTLGAQASPSNK